MTHRIARESATVVLASVVLLAWPRFTDASAGPAGPVAVEEGSDQTEDEKADPTALKYSASAGLSLFAGAIASAALPSEIYKKPPPCRWCEGANPNLIDRWARKARWEDPCRAARLSNTALGVVGAVALLPMSRESRGREWLVNAGAVVDSVSVTVMLTQVVKYTVRRARPAASTCHPERSTEPDRNLSFFSGHAAVAFAMVSSAHEAARLRGRPRNDWLWVGGAAAAATGYFRVAGDRHHLVDVVTGAGVGYFVGAWVTRHLHGRAGSGLTQAPVGLARPSSSSPPMFAYARSVLSGDRRVLVQVGKGPGRSLQLGISF